MARVNNRQAEDEIRALRPFDNNQSTLGGGSRFRGWGKLPQEQRDEIEHTGIDNVIYWVYSLGTPIAWVFDDATAYCPAIDYSRPATAAHQRIAARGLNLGLARVGGA